jgi:hypothetical protein
MEKSISSLVMAVLALSILVPGTLSAREKRGADLVITLKAGQTVAGELIAVRPDALLLFNGRDESVDLDEIGSLRVVRKSKALLGTACGFLAGALFTGVAAAAGNNETAAIFYGGIVGVAGGLVGFVAGSAAGKDETIPFDGMSESERAKFLERLRRKARVRD